MTARRGAVEALVLLAASSAIGLLANALSGAPVPVFSSVGPGAWPQRAPRLTVEELRERRPTLILDVRRAAAYAEGHPAGALHAPYEGFEERYAALDLGRRIGAAERTVVVCEAEDCPSGDRTAKILADLGHANVRVLHGGWKAYAAAGLPVEKGGGP